MKYRKVIWLLVALLLLTGCGASAYWFFGTEFGQMLLALGAVVLTVGFVWNCLVPMAAISVIVVIGLLAFKWEEIIVRRQRAKRLKQQRR